MMTKITDTLWLDLDRLVRVDYDRYSLDFGDRVVTYVSDDPSEMGVLLNVLNERNLKLMEKMHDADTTQRG